MDTTLENGRRNELPALKLAMNANHTEPSSAPLRFNIGERLRACGRTAEAAIAYEQAACARDGDVPCRFAVALALLRLERFDEAESELRHVIELEPEFTAAYEELAALLMRLDRAEESASVCCLGVRENRNCASLYGRWGAALAAQRRSGQRPRVNLAALSSSAPNGHKLTPVWRKRSTTCLNTGWLNRTPPEPYRLIHITPEDRSSWDWRASISDWSARRSNLSKRRFRFDRTMPRRLSAWAAP